MVGMVTESSSTSVVQDNITTRLVQWFEDSEDSTITERINAERDRDYYDNKQLTGAEIRALKKRGQPPIVLNRIKRKVNFLRGVEMTQRVDPKAFPRNAPNDEEAATAATDALRYVSDNNNLDNIRSRVFENLLIEGMGGAEISVEEESPAPRVISSFEPSKMEIKIRYLPWDRLFRDPHSSRPDMSDARYFGYMVWMDFDEAVLMWPDGKDKLEATLNTSLTDTFDDRPKHRIWSDKFRKRVRIVKINARFGGKWHIFTYTYGGILEGGVSPYEDEFGEPMPDIVLASAYIDRENARYGEVRELIDPQDEINKRRSKALHLLNQRQVIAEEGAVDDPNKARAELAKPDGYVKVNQGALQNGRFEIAQNNDLALGQFQLLQHAMQEMDGMGPNASMTGKSDSTESGRAIQAQQQGGFIELTPLMDNLKDWDIRVYRMVWNRVQQFWTDERWVRVTDDERNVKFVGLNRPVTAGELFFQELEERGVDPAEIEQRRELLQGDPRLEQVVRIENSPASMDMDIVIEDVPDTVTIQAEQFGQLVALVQAGIPFPPEVLIEASQLRNKDKLLESIRGGGDDPAAAQIRQAMLSLEIAEKESDIEKTQAETIKIRSETQTGALDAATGAQKSQADTTKVKAETLRTIKDITSPPEISSHI